MTAPRRGQSAWLRAKGTTAFPITHVSSGWVIEQGHTERPITLRRRDGLQVVREDGAGWSALRSAQTAVLDLITGRLVVFAGPAGQPARAVLANGVPRG